MEKRKVSQQRFYEHYGQDSQNGIDDRQCIITEQCKGLKSFTHMGLMKKKRLLILRHLS